MESTPSIKRCIVLERTKSKITMKGERDFWWHKEMQKCKLKFPCRNMDSEDPLFILYTSGSTGKPKGIQHTTCWLYDIY